MGMFRIGVLDHASTDKRCADRREEFRRNGYLDGRGSVAAVGGTFHEEFVGEQRALERDASARHQQNCHPDRSEAKRSGGTCGSA